MRTFAIVNRKGGVGKTTTAVNLAYVLATSCHLRVLLVDADGQANATQILLPRGEYAGLGALLRGYAICYDELTVHTDVEGLDVLPASEDLWALDLEARAAGLRGFVGPGLGGQRILPVQRPDADAGCGGGGWDL